MDLSIEPKTKVINGRTYVVTPLPAFRGCDAFEMLSKLIGPGLGALQTAGLQGGLEGPITALCRGLGGGQIRSMVQVLLADTRVTWEGKESAMLDGFDLRYAGKLYEVFQVLAFAVEVNFGDFYAGLQSLLGNLQPKVPASISPSA